MRVILRDKSGFTDFHEPQLYICCWIINYPMHHTLAHLNFVNNIAGECYNSHIFTSNLSLFLDENFDINRYILCITLIYTSTYIVVNILYKYYFWSIVQVKLWHKVTFEGKLANCLFGGYFGFCENSSSANRDQMTSGRGLHCS